MCSAISTALASAHTQRTAYADNDAAQMCGLSNGDLYCSYEWQINSKETL